MNIDIYNALKEDLLDQLRKELQNEILIKLRNNLMTEMRNEFKTELRNEIRSEIRNELLGIKQFVPITKFRYDNINQYDSLYENVVAFNIFQTWYISHISEYETINIAFNKLITNEEFIEINSNGFIETKYLLWSVVRKPAVFRTFP